MCGTPARMSYAPRACRTACHESTTKLWGCAAVALLPQNSVTPHSLRTTPQRGGAAGLAAPTGVGVLLLVDQHRTRGRDPNKKNLPAEAIVRRAWH